MSTFTATGFDPLQMCADTCSNTTVCVGAAYDSYSGAQTCWLKNVSTSLTGNGGRHSWR
jgi:hypothetical protein